MKRIVDGVTYNTETSTLLAQYEWDNGEESGIDRLYQTRGGAFFIDEEAVKSIWNEREREHEERRTHTFVPKSPDGAHKWLLECDNLEIFHNPFDDPPEATAEAEPGATIYVRVPSALKKRVDDAAREAKSSGNIWAMRCIERCLDPNPDAKEELAAAHWALLTIRAHIGDGLSQHQVVGLLQEAIDQLQTAWGDLSFTDSSGDSDIETQIMGCVDDLTRERLNREYPLYEGQ